MSISSSSVPFSLSNCLPLGFFSLDPSNSSDILSPILLISVPPPLPSLFRRLTGDLCDEINADQKRSCAVSATIKATDLYPTNGVLYEYMNAIIAATPEGDSDQCPTLGNLVPYFSGEHGTDDDNPYHNAREDNSSHAPVFDP